MTLRFGTDGVRGVANRDLTPELVVALGRAAARVLGTGAPFLVARDTRRSGPMLEAALAAGLCAEGADVERCGVLPTPGVAHVARRRGAPAAMISASHNPAPDNGIKLFAVGGTKIPDEAEDAIEATMRELLAQSGAAIVGPEGAAVGELRVALGARDDYAAHLVQALDGRRLDGLAVVVDCGHGAASDVAPLVFAELGAIADVRNAAPDGLNINAGCGSTHPEPLAAVVVDDGADVGLAFDGDADRVVLVDETGGLVDGDHVLAILALDLRERGLLRNDAIATTVMANLGLRRALEGHGIRVVETPVGDRHVVAAMAEHDLVLGGEQSGHIVLSELASTGDGMLTGLAVLDVMVRTGRSLSELAAVVTKYPQVLRNVRVAARDGLEGASGFWAEVQAAEADLGSDGRVLVRPSGTEPVVRVMVEAPTEAVAAETAERLAGALAAALGSA